MKKTSFKQAMKKMNKVDKDMKKVTIESTSNPRVVALHQQVLDAAARVKKEGING